MKRVVAAGAAFAAMLALGACSSTSEQVSDKIGEQAQSDLELKSKPKTTCPEDAKAKKGEKFECKVEVEGKTVTVAVEFTDDSHFNFQPLGRVHPVDEVVDFVKEQAAAQGVEIAELDCPGETYVVIDKGETIECTGTDVDGAKGTAKLSLDEDGNVILEDLVPEG